MGLTITVRQREDVRILELSGRLVHGEPIEQMRDTARRLQDENSRYIVLNLAGVSYMDSSGLGQTIAMHTSAMKRNGRIALVSLSNQTKHLMQIAKLLTVFDVYESEAEALSALLTRRRLEKEMPVAASAATAQPPSRL